MSTIPWAFMGLCACIVATIWVRENFGQIRHTNLKEIRLSDWADFNRIVD